MGKCWFFIGFYGKSMVSIWIIYGSSIVYLDGGLVYLPTSEKYEFVNWDFNKFPTEWKKKHVLKHQPVNVDPAR